jgi:hypothetical protein
MNREYPAPSHRSRREDPDQSLRVLGGLGEKPGAGTVGRSPVLTPLAKQVFHGGHGHGNEHEEEKNGEVSFHEGINRDNLREL